MAFRFYRESKQAVKFAEDNNNNNNNNNNNKDSAVRRINATETESMKSLNEGPFFPNLQLMFKNKQQETSDLSEEKMNSKTSSNRTPARNEEDINMEADEYIKRKHHNLYLQKLMSMNAAAQPR